MKMVFLFSILLSYKLYISIIVNVVIYLLLLFIYDASHTGTASKDLSYHTPGTITLPTCISCKSFPYKKQQIKLVISIRVLVRSVPNVCIQTRLYACAI